ncbi:MAG: serine protein kinase RIO [Candidatus Diapherotrites archaeon]|nr:serine protein kinase RIO [Candidatus Diapherotrites archaeon]
MKEGAENQYARMIKEYISEEKIQKTFNQVFDHETILGLHELAEKGMLEKIEHVISTGKEAQVFRAIDVAGNFRAIKIYKTKTATFRQMEQYIQGDMRFEKIKHDPRSLINAWARKEFKNLELIQAAEVRCPHPLGFQKNILIMEFIGDEKGNPALNLKENPITDLELLYDTVTEYVARMVERANLVHADLSEYNILNLHQEAIIIDCGQGVLKSHPEAKTFYERDVQNLANYFTKMGYPKTQEEMLKKIKEKREKQPKR